MTVTSESQREEFNRMGFLKVEGLIGPSEATALRNAIVHEVAEFSAGRREGDERYIFARTNHILEISNLFNILPEFSDLSVHARLAAVGAELIDVESLRLYHDALLYKTKEHPAVPWHQDDYFSVLDGKAITAWMPLVPVSEEEGALIYAPGSAGEGLVDVGGLDDTGVDALLREKGFEFAACSLQPGDVLFHSNLVFHRSNVNVSDVPRIAVSTFLFEDGASIREPVFGKSDIVDMVYFPEREVGDSADTHLNPVVYPAPGQTTTVAIE